MFFRPKLDARNNNVIHDRSFTSSVWCEPAPNIPEEHSSLAPNIPPAPNLQSELTFDPPTIMGHHNNNHNNDAYPLNHSIELTQTFKQKNQATVTKEKQ